MCVRVSAFVVMSLMVCLSVLRLSDYDTLAGTCAFVGLLAGWLACLHACLPARLRAGVSCAWPGQHAPSEPAGTAARPAVGFLQRGAPS